MAACSHDPSVTSPCLAQLRSAGFQLLQYYAISHNASAVAFGHKLSPSEEGATTACALLIKRLYLNYPSCNVKHACSKQVKSVQSDLETYLNFS
ncbi:hypothetical protein BaRGS_00012248 [Batillaria attramentaria]|uniref:Uncharacterized protein n=1 Tax=Batillaria attramentaria TaxID=370345 RepID=A0ABD0LBC2_9CAEN